MNSLLITLALANPEPGLFDKLKNVVNGIPELKNESITICLNEDCEDVEQDIFDPSNAHIQPLWETAYNSAGDNPAPPKVSKPNNGGSVAGDIVTKIVNGVVGATSVVGSVEVDYKKTEKDGSSTEIKVKVNVNKGGAQMKGPPVTEN